MSEMWSESRLGIGLIAPTRGNDQSCQVFAKSSKRLSADAPGACVVALHGAVVKGESCPVSYL